MKADAVTALVLAAGKGVRMKSELPKVMHPILGRPMVEYVIDAVRAAGVQEVCLVVGFGKELLKSALASKNVSFIEQPLQLGTGHAVQCFAKEHLEPPSNLLIVCGDTPLLSSAALEKMLEMHFKERPACTMMTLKMKNPGMYGRILRRADGTVLGVKEAKDCTESEKSIDEVNLSVYLFEGKALYDRIFKLDNKNKQGEYYLTDVIEMLVTDGLRVITVLEEDEQSTLGVNSRADLAVIADILRKRILAGHLAAGVSIMDLSQTWIEPSVKIGVDTVVWPGCVLTDNTVIGARSVIGPNVFMRNAEVGEGCSVRFSILEDTKIPNKTHVLPFSHITGGLNKNEGILS